MSSPSSQTPAPRTKPQASSIADSASTVVPASAWVQARIEALCEPFQVLRLDPACAAGLPWPQGAAAAQGAEAFPVCLARGLSRAAAAPGASPFRLFTFFNWLRAGIRVVEGEDAYRFQVFKGFGLTLPEAYLGTQGAIGRLFGYRVARDPGCLGSPFGVLEMGGEERIAGAALMRLLLPDVQGYHWLAAEPAMRLPRLQGAYVHTPEFWRRLGLPEIPCGQIVRSFRNPFRITDLQLLLALAREASDSLSVRRWETLAEDILELGAALEGCPGGLPGYLIRVAGAMGQIGAALVSSRILHGQLTDHCQNVTLAGELTEFDYAVKIPQEAIEGDSAWDLRSRLVSQVPLVGNHLRHLAASAVRLGVRVPAQDLAQAFASAMRAGTGGSDTEMVRGHLSADPYCLDIMRSAHNPHSEVNLAEGGVFISALHKALQEAFS